MISDNKYVNASKMEQPIIKSVGFNNEDVLITENGTYEAKAPYTGFGKVIVDVPVSAETPIGWIPKHIEYNGVWMSPVLPDLTGLTAIHTYAYAYAYYRNTYALMTIDFSNIRQIDAGGLFHTFDGASVVGEINLSGLVSVKTESLAYTFYSSGISSLNLSNLVEIPSGIGTDTGCLSYVCSACLGLTSVNISHLKNIGNYGLCYAFNGCSSLQSIDVSSIETVGQNGLYRTFYNSGLRGEIIFNNLKSMGNNAFSYCFYNCYYLTSIKFPALTTESFGNYNTQFVGMLNGIRGCELHFPSNLSDTISRLSGYPNFTGINTVILFDLPATE